jgi:spermidine synthase
VSLEPTKIIIYLLFFFSGLTGLIYESTWSHYLGLYLGNSSDAQVVVLVIFMGGLALGAALSSRYCNRIKHLFLAYAIVECLIGLSAFLFHGIFELNRITSYNIIFPYLRDPLTINLYKWIASALLIFPQTILLGATFPFFTNATIRCYPRFPGKEISMLYFTNSFGAAIGVLMGWFIFVYYLGFPGTMQLAGVINIIVAMGSLALHFQHHKRSETQALLIPKKVAEKHSPILWTLLVCAAFTGTASFMYEIGWIRMLSLVLGSSTHSFELMLSAFIFGIALGGLFIKYKIESIVNHIKFLAIIQLVMAALALSTLLSYTQMFYFMRWLVYTLPNTNIGYHLFNISSLAISILIMVPTTICAGMTLPLLTYILLKKNLGEKSIGAVYATNTAGSIIGIVAAVLLMPWITVKGVIVGGGIIDAILGILLLNSNKARGSIKRKKIIILSTATVSLIIITATIFIIEIDQELMISGVYSTGALRQINNKINYYKDGRTATVSVRKYKNLQSIATNGKTDGSINMGNGAPSSDERTQILTAALPWSIKPSTKRVAIIGVGTGVTSHVMLAAPSIERVDTIEIEKAMVEGAKLFKENNKKLFESKKSHIHIGDAKSFFSRQNKYDIIISEPSNPWVRGVAGLFTIQFYETVNKKLAPQGLYVQWLQTYELNMGLVASVLAGISQEFKYYDVYAATSYDLLIIASATPIPLPTNNAFRVPEIKALLKRTGLHSIDDLLFCRIASKDLFDSLLLHYKTPTNSDYHPYLDQRAVKARFFKKNISDLGELGYYLPLDFINNNETTIDFSKISYAQMYSKSHVAWLARSLYKEIGDSNPSLFDQKKWNESLYSIGDLFASYLNQKEFNKAFSIIKSKGSNEKLSETNKDYFNLYLALGNRKANKMLHFALKLLKNSNIPVFHKKYFLDVAMLAYAHKKEYNNALQLEKQYSSLYKDTLQRNTTSLLLHHYIIKKAKDRAKKNVHSG